MTEKSQNRKEKKKMTEKMLKNKLSFFANSTEIFFPSKKKIADIEEVNPCI
jgi:hypothetical protein